MSSFDSQPGRDMPAAPTATTTQSEVEHGDLAAAVQGLAGLVAGASELEPLLADVAGYTVASVPGADGAGVTVIHSGRIEVSVLAWSVTDPFVREIDHLQYDVCGQGPCLTAMQTRRPVVSGSLGSDPRWRRFGSRVARLGIHSALSLPLIVLDEVVGALNIYARAWDTFTEHAVNLAAQFSVPAAVAVRNAQVLHDAQAQTAQLQHALTSRATIDQAIGILRSRAGGDAAEAFARLRQISQAENVKVAVIAQQIVEEAVRRANARHTKS